MNKAWPADLPVARVRVARPTDRFEEVIAFYHEGLGLPIFSRFTGAGYTGVLLGMPDMSYHLEFTHHEQGSDCPAPSRDNLLVFYFTERAAIERIAERLHSMGYPEVEPENPYWSDNRSITIADPDGWRIVLFVLAQSLR